MVFIKNFLAVSGSLREVARQYGVTYPTVRLRLDRLIQKNQVTRGRSQRPVCATCETARINDKIDFDTAKVLVAEYRKVRNAK